jgi:hypothetical protein
LAIKKQLEKGILDTEMPAFPIDSDKQLAREIGKLAV